MTIATIAQLARVYDCSVAYHDRGNGCGGPGYIDEGDAYEDQTPLTQVSEADDPHAWELARDAVTQLRPGCSEPTVVCVGEEEFDGDFRPGNPHQRVYFV